MCIHIHRQLFNSFIKKKGKITSEFKTTLPHTKNPQDTLTHPKRRKITVREKQNYSNAHTPTHTRTHTTTKTYHISKRANPEQSRHALRKRENNLYIKPTTEGINIQTENKSEFKSQRVLNYQGFVPHMFSDESNKLETYRYIARMWRTK